MKHRARFKLAQLVLDKQDHATMQIIAQVIESNPSTGVPSLWPKFDDMEACHKEMIAEKVRNGTRKLDSICSLM